MKRLGIVGVLVGLLALVVAPGAGAASSHKLKGFEARETAQGAASEFQLRRDLDSYSVGRCKRQARRRVLCVGTATGENSRAQETCRMRIRVRAVHPGYWTTRANVVWRRCHTEAKPYLTYAAARAAIQAAGNGFAAMPTLITSMSRRDDLTFAGTARWVRPTVPPSELFPTETCSVELVATLEGGAVAVANDGFYCF